MLFFFFWFILIQKCVNELTTVENFKIFCVFPKTDQPHRYAQFPINRKYESAL